MFACIGAAELSGDGPFAILPPNREIACMASRNRAGPEFFHPTTMSELPPLMRDQRKVDADHVKLLAIFHFVLAGLSLAGLAFLFLHWMIMHSFMGNPALWKDAKGGPPPAEFFAIFKWFYVFFGVVIVTLGLGNLLSGWCLLKRRARMFSLVVAGVNCLGFPFGTALGVFTLIILLRESVIELYSAGKPASTNPISGG